MIIQCFIYLLCKSFLRRFENYPIQYSLPYFDYLWQNRLFAHLVFPFFYFTLQFIINRFYFDSFSGQNGLLKCRLFKAYYPIPS